MLTDAQRAIIAKDLREVMASRQVWLPMLLVPSLMAVVLPAIFVVTSAFTKELPQGTEQMLKGAGLVVDLSRPGEAVLRVGIEVLFPTLFLLIPVMASSVLAGSSIVGEREHKTIETILYSPITTRELFVAKVIGSIVPGLLVTLISVIAFGAIVDVGGWVLYRALLFPTLKWILVVFWLGPAMALLALTVIVLVSARAATFQEAQQFSALVVIPIVLLLIGQSTGLMMLSAPLIIVAGAVLFAIDAVLIRAAARRFTAEKLL